MALGAILLCALILPIVGLIGSDIPHVLPQPDFAVTSESTMADVIEDAYKDGIKRLICIEWCLGDNAVNVSVSGFDASTVTAQSVTVTLCGEGIGADRAAIARYLTECGINNCEVKYEYGTNI